MTSNTPSGLGSAASQSTVHGSSLLALQHRWRRLCSMVPKPSSDKHCGPRQATIAIGRSRPTPSEAVHSLCGHGVSRFGRQCFMAHKILCRFLQMTMWHGVFNGKGLVPFKHLVASGYLLEQSHPFPLVRIAIVRAKTVHLLPVPGQSGTDAYTTSDSASAQLRYNLNSGQQRW